MSIGGTGLTKTQRAYLEAMEARGRLRQGWGGHGSSLTVRVLSERGLATVRWFPGLGSRASATWEAQITQRGRQALKSKEETT